MSLFENEREANERSCVAMIEEVLGELGHDPAASRVQTATGEPGWRFEHGSATVSVSLINRSDFTHLRVVAPVMTTDARVDVLKLYRHLLTLNASEVPGAAFAAYRNEIQLVAERSTIDLDRGEVADMVTRVREYADDYDDKLVTEFGGRRGGN
jgi:hypothetical protein